LFHYPEEIEQGMNQDNHTSHGTFMRTTAFILIPLSLVWVGYLLHGIVTEHGVAVFIPSRPGWLALAMVLLTGSLVLVAFMFRQFLSVTAKRPLSPVWAIQIHAAGQVVRYLPGRFLGVIYQIGAARDHLAPSAITRANVDLMVFGLLGNLTIALFILGWTESLPRFLAYPAAASGFVLLGTSFLGGTNSLLRFFTDRVPLRMKRTRSFFMSLADSTLHPSVLLYVACVFLVSWVLYLGAWLCLGRAFVILDQANMITLCAWYSLAWMVGFASALTPGGLGVREGAFLAMAGAMSGAGIAAFVAILARFWLMLGDILLWLMVLPFSRARQKRSSPQPPQFDDQGLNVFDPSDTLGIKTAYITILQEKALNRHLPRGRGGTAVDVGCGYGRLTAILQNQGWRAVGMDPSWSLLVYARSHHPGPDYVQAGLPDLPVKIASSQLILMQNLLRALFLGKRLALVHGIGRYLGKNGWVVVVDNIRDEHPEYLPEQKIIDIFTAEGCKLVHRVPIRAARWWLIYCIRYGLIPRAWLPRIADWELNRMEHRVRRPCRQYYNVLFIFQKPVLTDTIQSDPPSS
jgi:SAM-dependent methyltransferase